MYKSRTSRDKEIESYFARILTLSISSLLPFLINCYKGKTAFAVDTARGNETRKDD